MMCVDAAERNSLLRGFNGLAEFDGSKNAIVAVIMFHFDMVAMGKALKGLLGLNGVVGGGGSCVWT
jgi:hypothetical protein